MVGDGVGLEHVSHSIFFVGVRGGHGIEMEGRINGWKTEPLNSRNSRWCLTSAHLPIKPELFQIDGEG